MHRTHGPRHRGWLVLAAAGALALLPAACAADEPPQAETESITTDPPPATGEAPASDTTAGEAPPAGGGDGNGRSRESPAAPGQPLEVGEWAVAVQATDADAADVILAENQFNRPPPDGHVFALARVDLRYQGEGSARAWLDLRFQVLTPDGNTHGGLDDRCGVIPDSLDEVGEMFAGASASGNVCAAVPAAQAEGAMWVVDQTFAIGDAARAFVAFE